VVNGLVDQFPSDGFPFLPSGSPEGLREKRVVAGIGNRDAGSLDDKIEKGLCLGVTEAGRRLRPSFSEKHKKLVKILRGNVINGRVAKKGIKVSEQIPLTLPGLLLSTGLLMFFQ
jgi:hypothetical protein